ncbi:MAG TPA: anti-sigma factor domain-containing protein [Proteiniclasticum sp.]|nr:anti-sigma factor domain-containing protein [Proteiniclasticum sp.]
MKATVVQINGKYAVLLQEDGLFIKVKTMNLKIGDVMDRKQVDVYSKRKFGSMIAAALFAVLIGGGVYTYGATSYHVSLDVNPGITMDVNMFDRVIDLEAVNADAQEVLEGMELENKNIEKVISQVVERISDLGYFDDEDGTILIAATAKNKENTEQTAEKLGNAIEEEIEEKDIDAEVTFKVVGHEMVEAAKAIEGMTPGKYNLIVNLLKVAPEEAAEYAETSIKNIMKMVNESKEIQRNKKSEDVSENEQNKEDKKKEPASKEFKEKNTSELPVQAGLKEKNSPIDTPASYRKSPNAKAMGNNSVKRSENSINPDESENNDKIEDSGKPERIEIPVIDVRKEKPEAPSDPDIEAVESESKDQEGQSDRKPETPAGERP